MFDRTNGASTGYSQRLNGSENEKYGLARSLSVVPGDVVSAEVYAKYVDTNSSNWNATLTTLMGQIASGTAGVVVDGINYASSTSTFPAVYPNLVTKTDNGAPKAYLNWLVFDRNYVFLDGGFKQISTVARETGTDVAHEYLASPKITITQPGYVYIYISNENATNVEVYFDDFRVAQAQNANVIQAENYYMFGMAFQEYQKEGSVANPYKYNGKEEQDEINLGWLDYGARMYMPEIGSWGVIDPMAEKVHSSSPYMYAFGSPVVAVDPDGREGTIYIQVLTDKKGKSAIDRKFIDAAVKGLNQLFKSKGVDLKVEAHFGNKIMSKKEFYERKGADKSDSYTIIGGQSNLKAVAKEAKEKGWEEIKGNNDGFNSLQGESAKKDFFSLINANAIVDANGKVINKDIIDPATKIWETEDYQNP